MAERNAGRLPRCISAAAVSVMVAGCAGTAEVSDIPRVPVVEPAAAPAVQPAAQPMAQHGDCRGSHHSYTVKGRRYWVKDVPAGYLEKGTASWYGKRFHGKKTASGEIFDMHQMSAAHKTLPMFSIVRVTNLANGREVTVRINDRGPFADERLIDLSYAAAKKLKMVKVGVAPVEVIVTSTPRDKKRYAMLMNPVRN